MLSGINLQNEVLQQSLKTPSRYASLQSTDIQSEVQRQENKKQQSKEDRNTEDLDIEGVNIKKTDLHISGDITSSPTGSPGSSTRSTGQQETVESIGDISERINAAANAFASVGQIDTIGEEAVESDNGTQDKVYRKQVTKPRLIVGSRDANYKKDKGGNHHMALTYDSANNIKFFKDDNPVIIIKNDNVKNVGGFFKFCSEIEKECEQKMSEGKKYYFEDYLDNHGFIKKEIDINEIRRKIELLRKKRYSGIQK